MSFLFVMFHFMKNLTPHFNYRYFSKICNSWSNVCVNINYVNMREHRNTTIDLRGWNTNDGANIGIWYKNNNWNNNWNQKFYLNTDGVIVVGGKCVDLYGNNRTNFQPIKLWTCNGSSAQKWVYDTEGRIRLKDNTYWCIDTYTGNAGESLLLFNCNAWTKQFRAGSYEMKLFVERGFPYGGDTSDVGHSWVAIQKMDDWNHVSENSTYGFWSGQDDRCYSLNYAWNALADRCIQQVQSYGQNMGSIEVNLINGWNQPTYYSNPDQTWANDLHNQPYNNWNYKQQNRAAFKIKNINQSQANDIRGAGFAIPYYTNENNLIQQLTYDMQNGGYWWWFIPYWSYYSITVMARFFVNATVGRDLNDGGSYDLAFANCTNYAVDLWKKYDGVGLNYKWWGIVPLPTELYNQMNNSYAQW